MLAVAAAPWAASRGSALPAALCQTRAEGRMPPAPPAAGCGAARAEWRRRRLPQPSSRPVLPFASGGAFHLPCRPPRPRSDTLRRALGTERELFVSPQDPGAEGGGRLSSAPRHRPSQAAPPPPAPHPAAWPARPCLTVCLSVPSRQPPGCRGKQGRALDPP